MKADSRLVVTVRLGWVVAATAWVLGQLPLLTAGAADMRMVLVFQPDEVAHVNLLRWAIDHGSMRIIYGPYGHLFFNLALIPLHAWNAVSPVSDLQILGALRLVSLLFGGATIALAGVWVAEEIGIAASIVAGAALALSPLIVEWSSFSHPDAVQMFFLAASLYATCQIWKDRSRRWVQVAAGAAGLAFATKYSGLFVLPFIGIAAVSTLDDATPEAHRRFLRWARVAAAAVALAVLLLLLMIAVDPARFARWLSEDGSLDAQGGLGVIRRFGLMLGAAAFLVMAAAALPAPWNWLERRPRLVQWLQVMTYAAAVFVAAFLITSPYSLRKLVFLKGLYYMGNRLANASLGDAVLLWAQLTRANVPLLLLVAVPLAWLLCAVSADARGRNRTRLLLTSWLLLYGAIIVGRLRVGEPRFLLPLFPALAWFAADAYDSLINVAGRRRLVAAALAVAAVIVMMPGFVTGFRALRDRGELSATVAAGTWLACAVPPERRIAFDYMAYVPAAFAVAEPTWGGTLAWREEVRPDAIAVRTEIADLYLTDTPAATTGWSPEKQQYYRCLEDGSCGFTRRFANSEARIYVRDAPAAEAPQSPGPGC